MLDVFYFVECDQTNDGPLKRKRQELQAGVNAAFMTNVDSEEPTSKIPTSRKIVFMRSARKTNLYSCSNGFVL